VVFAAVREMSWLSCRRSCEVAANGYSWTLSQSIAGFFAQEYFRNVGSNPVPVVVRATVSRSLIKAHIVERDESEVVIVGLIRGAALCVPPV
jgi:hypothetical protein